MSGGQACVCVKGVGEAARMSVWVRLVCVCVRGGRSRLYECLGSGLCVCVQGTGEACMSVWGSGLCVCERDVRSLYECLGSGLCVHGMLWTGEPCMKSINEVHVTVS